MICPIPKKIVIVPSVTMKGTTFVALISTPLANPHRAPRQAPSPISAYNIVEANAGISRGHGRHSSAARRERFRTASVPFRPTRSIPAAMMMIVMPKAGTAINAAELMITRRLRGR